MEPFEIEIDDPLNNDTYKLKGHYTTKRGVLKAFDLDKRACKYCGFGGSIDYPLPGIAIFAIEDIFADDIKEAIRKHIEERL
jgi:hypothetical protein